MISKNHKIEPIKKILILSANPVDTNRLSLDREVRDIENGLLRAKKRDYFEIITKWAVRFEDIVRALLDFKPHIVHFAGHGNKDGLMVESELGIAEPISKKALSGLFELNTHYVECVLLNACFSAVQADVIKKHINYVIGTPGKIKDKAAVAFAVGFYDALGAGKFFEEAFKFGRISVYQMFPNLLEDCIPHLIKKEAVNIPFCIETTGNISYFQFSLDEKTATAKNQIINTLKFPHHDEKGYPIIYYLWSKKRETIMDDNNTLRENLVRENEEFVFLIESDAE